MNSYYPVRAANVCFTLHHQGMWSRFQIMAWINSELESDLCKVEELCSGAAYCCLMDKLFPGTINMLKVKYQACQEYQFLANFRLVQNAFVQVRVDAQIPMAGLVKGRLTDNLEFASWFRRFYERNYNKLTRHAYDPLAARGNQYIGFGPSRPPTSSEMQAMRCHRRYVRLSYNQDKTPQKLRYNSQYQIGQGDQLHASK